jgi:hypothetical protein
MSNTVLVFGSNEAGLHGAGAAKAAYKKHGARWGASYGHYGDSFAIPTKNCEIEPLLCSRIAEYVQDFLAYAKGHRKLTFNVTQIGCGLAGFTKEQIAPMFMGAPSNCEFDSAWKEILGPGYTYWGKF